MAGVLIVVPAREAAGGDVEPHSVAGLEHVARSPEVDHVLVGAAGLDQRGRSGAVPLPRPAWERENWEGPGRRGSPGGATGTRLSRWSRRLPPRERADRLDCLATLTPHLPSHAGSPAEGSGLLWLPAREPAFRCRGARGGLEQGGPSAHGGALVGPKPHVRARLAVQIRANPALRSAS